MSQEKLFETEPITTDTCRHCVNRVGYSYPHGNKVMQFCSIQTGRNQFSKKRIKVTDIACVKFEDKRKK